MTARRGDKTFRPVILAAFGPPTLACLRSWGRQGWNPGLIAVQGPGEARPRSRYLGDVTVLPPSALLTEAGVKIVADFLESFSASGLMCIDEQVAAWLNANREYFSPKLLWWIPPTETVNRVLSKIDQLDVAQKVGLDQLPTYFLEPRSSLPQIPAGSFPLCLRPSRPNSTRPAFKVRNAANPAELESFLHSLETVDSPLIGQPFTSLPNLVVHGARSAQGETFGQRAFWVARKFQGVTLTIKPCELSNDLAEKCRAFTDELDLIGNYHFEFLVEPHTGKVFFLEVNYRFGGTTAKVMACGYDEPAWTMASLGVETCVPDRIRSVTASSKQALIKSLLCALNNELTALDYPEETKARRLYHSLFGLVACRDDVFCTDDLEGTLGFYLDRIRVKVLNLARFGRNKQVTS